MANWFFVGVAKILDGFGARVQLLAPQRPVLVRVFVAPPALGARRSGGSAAIGDEDLPRNE